MSCEDCDEAQDKGNVAYIRIENANVLISGCDKHLQMLINIVRNRKEKPKDD